MIKQITIVSAPGVKTYQVGDRLSGGVIDHIRINDISFSGDLYSHYCGYDESGKLLFSVDPMCPHECEYL